MSPNARETRRRLLLGPLAMVLGIAATGCGDKSFESDIWGNIGDDEPKLAEIVFESAPRETTRPALFERTPPSMLNVLARIHDLGRDKNVKGIFLRVGGLGGSWARMADLNAALLAFKQGGKREIHCHFESTDNAGYALLASTCDRLSMTPAGWLDLVGVASQVLFFKSALDKLGLEADFVRMGKYKSAIEPLTQDTMSEPSRQAISELLEDFDTDLVSRVAKGRKLSEEKVRALIDEGPFDADRALELGLIDAVAFDDAAKQKFRDATKTKVIRKVPLRPEDEKVTLGRILEALTGGGKPQEPSGAHLAVVNVVGEIVDSEDTVPNQAASGPFVRHVRKLAYDDDVKAIVVRIDSPGGSALASDRMWHALHYAGKRKPIVVSIGDMAASGGYYIASAGKEVFAEPTSIVGSIGVFGGKISAANLADKVGVHVETIRRGKNAAWSSAASNFSDSERAVIQRMLERTYDRFVSRVSLSRGISREQVLSVAEGRVLTATRGERAGLVTKLGGFQAALDAARKLGGLDDDAPLAPWPSELGLLDALAGGDRDEAMLRAVLGERGAEELAPYTRASLRWALGSREQVFAILPFGLQIR